MTTHSKLPLTAQSQISLLLGRWRRGLLVTAAMLATQHAAMAQGELTGGEKTYRCVVLGETSACPAPMPQRSAWIEERVEPGPVAKHYMYLGMDRDDAIAQAGEQGEQPVRRLVRMSMPEMSGAEKYARVLGHGPSARVEQEVVAGSAEDDTTARCSTSIGV